MSNIAALNAKDSVSDGALYELGAIGPEETFTVCKPEQTFWVQCFKRHSNFSFAHVDFQFDQTSFAWNDNSILTATSPRHGDLLIGTYFKVYLERLYVAEDTVPRSSYSESPSVGDEFMHSGDEELELRWCEEVGNAMIRQAKWIVGNEIFDQLTGEMLHTYHEMFSEEGKLLKESIGRFRFGENSSNSLASQTFSSINRQLYVPLRFSYMEGSENAFPLVAASHERIKFELTLRGRDDVMVALDSSVYPAVSVADKSLISGGKMLKYGLSNEVVFLDKAEQKAYCDYPLEKYFEYTQGPLTVNVSQGDTEASFSHLTFNHSITSLFVYYRSNAMLEETKLEYFNFGTPLHEYQRPLRWNNIGSYVGGLERDNNPFQLIEFSENQAPRVSRQGVYWQEIQPRMRLKRVSSSYVCVYSFAEDASCFVAPTGASNVGRFAHNTLTATFLDTNMTSATPATPADDASSTFSGIGEAGQVVVFARTQNFYKVAGQRVGLRWSAV